MTTDRDTIARQAREIVALQKRLHDAESREPEVRERVIRKEVPVPGPVRERVVTKEVPGPTRYRDVPGPERTRVKIEYRESPRTAELERENARLKEQVKNLRHRLGGAK